MSADEGSAAVSSRGPTKRSRRPRTSKAPGIWIELSSSQIATVLNEVRQEGGVRGFLLAETAELAKRRTSVLHDPALADPQLSRGTLLTFAILASFFPVGSEVGVNEIARRLGLDASTVHRYVRTLVAMRLLEQNIDTRAYRLAAHSTRSQSRVKKGAEHV